MIPPAVIDAAAVLADHVDYWEEDTFGARLLFTPRRLTALMLDDGPLDFTSFRALAAEYAGLAGGAVDREDGPFHRDRRAGVREAVREVERWLAGGINDEGDAARRYAEE